MTIPTIFVHMNLKNYMEEAYALAQEAFQRDEVPIGAVIVTPNGEICGRGHNRILLDKDPTAHAEICALRAATHKLAIHRLDGHLLITTLEPCAMCAQAAALARIKLLVFGASDPKGGGVLHGPQVLHHTHHKVAVKSVSWPKNVGPFYKHFFKVKETKHQTLFFQKYKYKFILFVPSNNAWHFSNKTAFDSISLAHKGFRLNYSFDFMKKFGIIGFNKT